MYVYHLNKIIENYFYSLVLIFLMAMLNILIPTKQHEIHLTQNISCDCSAKIKSSNFKNLLENDKIANINLITMEKVSVKFVTNE